MQGYQVQNWSVGLDDLERQPNGLQFAVDAFRDGGLFDGVVSDLGELVGQFLDAVKAGGKVLCVGRYDHVTDCSLGVTSSIRSSWYRKSCVTPPRRLLLEQRRANPLASGVGRAPERDPLRHAPREPVEWRY